MAQQPPQPRVIFFPPASGSPELAKLFLNRRTLLEAQTDIAVKKVRRALKRASDEERERAVHAGILNGDILPMPAPQADSIWTKARRTIQKEIGGGEVVQFPQQPRMERAKW